MQEFKYREAAKLGWTVLRYTNKDYRNLTRDLREVMPIGSAMYYVPLNFQNDVKIKNSSRVD